MPSDPPLHVALGPDLRRPSVRLFKVMRCSLRRCDTSSVKVEVRNGSLPVALAPALAMSRCRVLLVAENKRREGSTRKRSKM